MSPDESERHILAEGFAENAKQQLLELIVNGRSLGIIKRSELPNNNNTVFIWNNISINKNEKNTIIAKATFNDDTVKYDKVCWYGDNRANIKIRSYRTSILQ